MTKKKLIIIASVLLLIGAAVTVFLLLQRPNTDTSVDTSALGSLPVRDNSTIDTSHLDPSLVPPTNTWFSGMALQKEPKAVFAMPLSFKPSDSGFEFGLPQVTTSARLITAPHTPDVSLSIADAKAFTITRYDKLSATLTYTDGDQKLTETKLV